MSGFVTYIAPSAWASYLVNGDASGLESEDIAACDAWRNSLDCIGPVGCEDAGFCRYHDAREYYGLATDCQTYTFLLNKRESA